MNASRFARRRTDSAFRQQTLEELTRAVAGVSDSATLRSLITRRFMGLAGAEAAWFVEFDAARSLFLCTWSDGGDPSRRNIIAFPPQGPLLKWLHVNEEPLNFPGDSGITLYLSEEERHQLEALDIRMCVPLFSVGRLRAVVLLTSTRRNWALPSELAEFLMICGRQAGLAFETIERHGAEVDRVRSAAHAQRLAVAGQLAAMVAHEVRNPLAIIRTAVQLVKDSDDGWEKRGEFLGTALTEVDRISATITGFLSLSRPATANDQIVDVVAVAVEAVRAMEAYAGSRTIEIRFALRDPSLPVLGDTQELRQVFLNLLINASQAMTGGGSIELRSDTRAEARPDGTGHRTMAVIEVADSGPGIAPEIIDRIFEPFVSTRANGTGLGLAICSQIVERHGGRICATNVPDHGAVFAVYLPITTGE